MAFAALDKDFNMIKMLNPINVQWRRKFYEYGTFEIQMVADDYSTDMYFIFNNITNELAFINKMEYDITATGQFILLDGYLSEFWLDRFISQNTYDTSIIVNNTKVEPLCRQQVKDSVEWHNLENKIVLGPFHNYPQTLFNNEFIYVGRDGNKYIKFSNIGIGLQKILTPNKLSQRMLYNINDNKIYYEVWAGLDRTQSQTTNSSCVFSDSLANIKNVKYSIDDSNQKNCCRINPTTIPTKEGEIVVVMPLDVDIRTDPDNEPEKEINYDYEGLLPESIGGSFDSQMQKAATLKLLDYSVIENLQFDVIPKKYEYRKDYDLGDTVDIRLDKLNKSWTAKIIGVTELYKNNTLTVKLELGNYKKMKYK